MDIDGDGIKDILSGCYSQRGVGVMVGTFWVLLGRKEGGFAPAVELKGTDGNILMVHAGKTKLDSVDRAQNTCTRPFAVDWDGDGDLDIVSGNFRGSLFLFTGEGQGRFDPKAVAVTDRNGRPLVTSGGHSDPFVIDWDGDGDLDLLAASVDGRVAWAQNTLDGTAPPGTDPRFAAFVTLIAPTRRAGGSAGKPKGPSTAFRIHVEDVNGDGKLDILVGDRRGRGGRKRSNLSDEEESEFKRLTSERSVISRRYSERRKGCVAAFGAAAAKAGELTEREQRALFKKMVTDKLAADEDNQADYKALLEYNQKLEPYKEPLTWTGHVWLYIQK